MCNITGYSHGTALSLYKNITCTIVGKNKIETEVSEVIFKTLNKSKLFNESFYLILGSSKNILRLHVTNSEHDATYALSPVAR